MFTLAFKITSKNISQILTFYIYHNIKRFNINLLFSIFTME